uniref:Uncharacterized protein n=1 Tax=Rhizophora mucronata TaxID=61149 RepID=A0A2P2NWR2_RHIMU
MSEQSNLPNWIPGQTTR